VEEIRLGTIPARVIRKKIKHIRLRIVPPNNDVVVSVPHGVPIEDAQALAMSKYVWLSERLSDLRAHDASLAQNRLAGNHIFFRGKHYALVFSESMEQTGAVIENTELRVFAPPGSSSRRRQELLDTWLRQALERTLEPLVIHWSTRMGIGPKRLVFQRMKTRWGTCNTATRTIRLNLMLVEKPIEYLEYTLVHEMTHLQHPNHGPGFASAMDGWLPNWRTLHRELDLFPRDPNCSNALSRRQ
jgi:predicted metal-dependent hydrolase